MVRSLKSKCYSIIRLMLNRFVEVCHRQIPVSLLAVLTGLLYRQNQERYIDYKKMWLAIKAEKPTHVGFRGVPAINFCNTQFYKKVPLSKLVATMAERQVAVFQEYRKRKVSFRNAELVPVWLEDRRPYGWLSSQFVLGRPLAQWSSVALWQCLEENGPAQYRPLGHCCHHIGRVLPLLSKELVDAIDLALASQTMQVLCGFTHGDFHGENALEAEDGSLWLLDYDLAVWNGVRGFDLMHLCAKESMKVGRDAVALGCSAQSNPIWDAVLVAVGAEKLCKHQHLPGLWLAYHLDRLGLAQRYQNVTIEHAYLRMLVGQIIRGAR